MTVDIDGILDVCAYHRRDFDVVLVRSRPHETQKVSGSLQGSFETPPTAGLGRLGVLPPELISIVLQNLDLLSYFRFRQINRQARLLSTEFPQYCSVAQHGLEGLRVLLRAHLAQAYTIGTLYGALTRERCELCHSFGGSLFLPTVTRCCFECIMESPDLRVMSTTTLARLTKMSHSKLQRLLGSQLRTVPGIYSMLEKRPKRPKLLAAVRPALAKLVELGVLRPDLAEAVLESKEQRDQCFMASTALPWYRVRSDEVDDGVNCKGCQVRLEAAWTSHTDYERDHVYSRADYICHFDSCFEAQVLWGSSNGGTKHVREPEFTRRGGWIGDLDNEGLPIEDIVGDVQCIDLFKRTNTTSYSCYTTSPK